MVGVDRFADALASVRHNRTSGAGALARQCLELLGDSALSAPAKTCPELLVTLNLRAAEIMVVRPSMAPIVNLVTRWQCMINELEADVDADLRRLRHDAGAAAENIAAASEMATKAAAARATDYLRGSLGDNRQDGFFDRAPAILTLSWSGLVADALAGLADTDIEIVVAESRPLNEGARLARFLAERGLPITLITDAQIAQFADNVDLAICGADTLMAEGSIVNKVGTRLMALAMNDVGRPLLAVSESFKIAPDSSNEDINQCRLLEEMPKEELGYVGPVPFQIRNVYFEVTPARLISTWCTEHGVFETARQFVQSISTGDP
jgi:translation initiation factor 2B subunit (eIF-2B alpha/beta/delta family)